MSIYTKTGDAGETGLLGGTRIPKDSLRVEAYGTTDELGAMLGLARSFCKEAELGERIATIQQKLFTVGAQLACDENGQASLRERIGNAEVTELERWIDGYMAQIARPFLFVTSGENSLSAALHVARTIARRGERSTLALSRVEAVDGILLQYLNRLSDALYAMALYAAKI